jgi:hypothetical protein
MCGMLLFLRLSLILLQGALRMVSRRPKAVADRLVRRAEKLTRVADLKVRDLAAFGSSFAQMIAPRQSGALASSIRFQKTGTGYAVISGKPRGSDRPYHLWWHGVGRYDLSAAARAGKWSLSGMADVAGVRDKNKYMTATARVLKSRLSQTGKSIVAEGLRI